MMYFSTVSASFTPLMCINLLLLSQYFLQLVICVTVEKDLTLTKNEKLALDMFRGQVSHILPEPYMQQDIYLIRWLRAKNLNLQDAKTMLLENLKWRQANNMSTIHQEDFSDMEENYPYFVDTFDKQGRPIATLRFGEWDIRRAIVSSRGPRLIRYLYKALDEVTSKVRALQEQGRSVTQWVSLLDMDGYNLVNHGCYQCLSVYLSYVNAYESYFPGSVHDIILINTPSLFEAVLRITRPLMREETKNMLHVFGSNRNQWQSYLLQHIDANQLELHTGGNKIRQ